MKNNTTKRTRRNRSGSTYLMVLSAVVIASAIAMGSLSILTSRRNTIRIEQDLAQTFQLAQSGTEFALANLQPHHDWRQKFSNYEDIEGSPFVSLGTGQFRWQVIDPADASIENGYAGPVRIIAEAHHGKSQRRIGVYAVQDGKPLDVLRTAVHANGNVSVIGDTVFESGSISSNSAINVSVGRIYGVAESPVIDDIARIHGTPHDGVPPKTMPAKSLFEIYRSMAQKAFVVESSGNQPLPGFEKLSAVDVAVELFIVPPNTTFTIENQTINATWLVHLQGENSKLVVGDGVQWSPTRKELPSLVVYTDSDSGTEISIHSAGQLNAGSERSSLSGLFHVIRDFPDPVSKTSLHVEESFFGSLIVDGDLEVSGTGAIRADRDLISHPPYGYTTAVDVNNRLANGDFQNGLAAWYGPKLTRSPTPSPAHLNVSNRSNAADGIWQDVTGWLESGQTINGSVEITLTKPENVEVTLQWETEIGGIERTSASAVVASTAKTQIPFSLTPTWTGELRRAKLLVRTSDSKQEFSIQSAQVLDSRPIKPAGLSIVPTSWRVEQDQ